MKRIVLAGGSGFLGRALAAQLQKSGYKVTVVTRSPAGMLSGLREIAWDACTLGDWARELEGAAGVINLAGRSVNCRCTPRNRRLIMDSRVRSTQVIGQAIAQCTNPPPVWLNASTVTIYKHTCEDAWDEGGLTGSTPEAKDEFSVAVATAWEEALNGAKTPGTRRIAMRTSMVLGLDKNSVFPVLRRLVRLGLGGRMGDGRQFVSWIHEEDFCRAVEWLITHDRLNGVVNMTAPHPISNAEMMKAFREVSGRSFGLPAARWMLEIGAFFLRTETELIIKSRRVVPGRLTSAGFQFCFPHLRGAFEDLAGRP